MSTRKIVLMTSIMSTAILAYYVVKKGIDVVLGIALVLSAISIALNLYCEVRKKEGEE